ncbi:MAG TPA: zf-HC2 domain-containing protein [Calditrichia bacterium]|nr:zf-HC2 domain-containing protein [Calditrichota bacterium]HQV30488.1 zf-HC2 domain-containing protein [Calditrichia bacterium]
MNQLLSRYALNLLSGEEKKNFETHLAECDVCFRELYEFAPVAQSILENKESLLEAMDGENSNVIPLTQPATTGRFASPRYWMIAAAVALILLAGSLLWNRGGQDHFTDDQNWQPVMLEQGQDSPERASLAVAPVQQDLTLKPLESPPGQKRYRVSWSAVAEASGYRLVGLDSLGRPTLPLGAKSSDTSGTINFPDRGNLTQIGLLVFYATGDSAWGGRGRIIP